MQSRNHTAIDQKTVYAVSTFWSKMKYIKKKAKSFKSPQSCKCFISRRSHYQHMAEVAWAITYLSTATNMPQAWTKLPTKRCTFRIESFRSLFHLKCGGGVMGH